MSNSAQTLLAAFRTNVEPATDAQGVGSIMWMPQGCHAIKAGTRSGEPIHTTVTVTAELVPSLNIALQTMLAAAEKGEGSKPYFDFNHDEEEASAWPTAFRWVEGKGIFADVEWSAPGKAAVTGKSYRYFSPAFLLSPDEPGRPFLRPELFCLGGLVNAPAFQRIQQVAAVAAKHAAAEGRVTTLETELATLKAEAVTLRASLETAAAQVAAARVDADLAGTENVPQEVRAMLVKTVLSDPAGASALLSSIRAAHRRPTTILLSPGTSLDPIQTGAGGATSETYTAYMARLNKSRS